MNFVLFPIWYYELSQRSFLKMRCFFVSEEIFIYLFFLRKCFITKNFSTGVVKIIVITTNISLIIFHLWCGNISLLSYSRSETFPYYLVFLVTFLFWFGNCSLLLGQFNAAPMKYAQKSYFNPL